MSKHSPELAALSSASWETLEAWARLKVRELVQALQEEVTELLGRRK